MRLIRSLRWWLKMRRQCKLVGYNCPECIYHNWTFDGCVFRGNVCRYVNKNMNNTWR